MMVQEEIQGDEYRILVVENDVVLAYNREPPKIV